MSEEAATATPGLIMTTGRRKQASARVRLRPGQGKITINGKPLEKYCCDESMAKTAAAPLETVEAAGKFDAEVKVAGGGPIGQAGAIAHGMARALEKFNPEWRVPLKKAGHLRRDPRKKERKKAGQPGARKRFQYSKR